MWVKRPLRRRIWGAGCQFKEIALGEDVEWEGLTCQTNGKLFRFSRANMRARNFQAPDLPAKPSLLRRVDKVGAIASEFGEASDL